VPPLYRLTQGGKTVYARDDAEGNEPDLLKKEFRAARSQGGVSALQGPGRDDGLAAQGNHHVALLVLYRIFWRLTHAAPALPASVSPLVARAAGLGHLALYLLMLAVPIIGVPTLLWRGRGLDFGLFQIASPFTRTPEIYKPLTEIHELGAFALVILALLHAAVGVWHQFVQKDGILLRMMPGR
jgi:hypothetical protein